MNDTNANLTASSARPRRMGVRAALLATAVFASTASAQLPPLEHAVIQANVAAVIRMLDAGADPNGSIDFDSPLSLAADGCNWRHNEGRNCLKVVKALLDRGADPNYYASGGSPPLLPP